MAGRSWLEHPAITALHTHGIRTRLGISPNYSSFRVGVLRTHLLTALLAHAAAHHLDTDVRIHVRWDDTDPCRSRGHHRAALLREIRTVAQIPLPADDPEPRQSQRGPRYQQALRHLLEEGVVVFYREVPCLDVAAVDRLLNSQGHAPERLTRSAAVNARVAPAPSQGFVPLTRGDGSALWHLATVVDDIDQRTTLVVRGTDKANATAVQVRLHRVLAPHHPVPAHVFVPRLLDQNSGGIRVNALLDEGIRPSALRWFLTEPYLTARGSEVVETFTDLVHRIRPILPSNADSRFDRQRLRALDRKASTAVSPQVSARELRDRGAPGSPQVVSWVASHYRRPLRQQLSLCERLSRAEVEYEAPPEQAEQALRWLDSWIAGTAVGKPPRAVRWVLTGRVHGPEPTGLVTALPRTLVPSRIRAARQVLSLSRAA